MRYAAGALPGARPLQSGRQIRRLLARRGDRGRLASGDVNRSSAGHGDEIL